MHTLYVYLHIQYLNNHWPKCVPIREGLLELLTWHCWGPQLTAIISLASFFSFNLIAYKQRQSGNVGRVPEGLNTDNKVKDDTENLGNLERWN